MRYLTTLFLLFFSFSIYSAELRLLAFSDYYGSMEQDRDYENLRQRTYIRPEFSSDILDYRGFFSISGEYYYDYFTNEETPQNSDILREAYFSFYLPKFDLTIGQKYTNKGKVDVFSPLNVYNASYRELLSLDESFQSKRPDLQLEINYYINDENSIELVYIPFPRPDYQGTDILRVTDGNLDFTLDKESDSYLTDIKHQSFYLTYNRYGLNSDLQLFYSYYTGRGYNFDLSGLNENAGILNGTLEKQYNKVHTFGLGYSTSIGAYSLNEEIAFNLTEDFDGTKAEIKNSDITVNSQVTKIIFGRVTSNLNVIYQHIINYDKAETGYSTTIDKELIDAFNDVHMQPTDHIVVLVGHLSDSYLRDKLYVAINSALLFPRVYIGPRVKYKLRDYLTLETGIDYFTGKYENYILEEDLGGDNFFIRFRYEL